MFVRRLRSRVGNIQIQVVEKKDGNNRVVRHIGTARNNTEQQELEKKAQQYIDESELIKVRFLCLTIDILNQTLANSCLWFVYLVLWLHPPTKSWNISTIY